MEWFWKELGLDEPTNTTYKVKQAYVTQMRELKKRAVTEEVSPTEYARLDEAEALAIAEIEEAERVKRSGSLQPVHETAQQVIKPVEPKAKEPVAAEVIEPSKPIKAKPKETHQTVQRKTKDAQAEIGRVEARRLANEKKQQETKKVAEATRVAKIKPQPVKEVPTPPPATTSSTSQLNQLVAKIKKLFGSWPEKVLLKEWENIFAAKGKWTVTERRYVHEEVLPQFKKELIFLPKEVLVYLYDELELGEVDEQGDYFWFREIQELPDLSFDIAHYLPEYEQEDYFNKRYRLYKLTQDPAWESYQFEIDQLQTELEEDSESVVEQGDQDVLNLIGINLVIENLDELTQRNGSSWNLLDSFSLTDIGIEQQDNSTTKFLQIVFTALETREIKLADGLYIENQENNYLEDNLQELLVGLTFYRCGDLVKAEKHFNKITNNYQYLVKSFSGNHEKTAPLLQNTPRRNNGSGRTINFSSIVRGFVVAIIAIGVIGSLFSNDDGDDYDYNYSESENYEDHEYWEYLASESEIDRNFSHLFLDDRFDEDLEFEREDFIDNFVSSDVQPLFEDYLEQWEEGDYPPYDYVRNSVKQPLPEENQVAYLITYFDDAQAIIYVEDGLIVKVIGRDWTPDGESQLAELAPSFMIQPAILQEKILNDFYLLPIGERRFDREKLGYLLRDEDETLSSYDEEIELPDTLEKAKYYTSTNEYDEDILFFLDEDDKFIMVFELDQFGRIAYVNYEADNEIDDELKETLLENASEGKSVTIK